MAGTVDVAVDDVEFVGAVNVEVLVNVALSVVAGVVVAVVIGLDVREFEDAELAKIALSVVGTVVLIVDAG